MAGRCAAVGRRAAVAGPAAAAVLGARAVVAGAPGRCFAAVAEPVRRRHAAAVAGRFAAVHRGPAGSCAAEAGWCA